MAICIVIYLIIGMIRTIAIYRELDKCGLIDSFMEHFDSAATPSLVVGLVLMTLLWPVLHVIGDIAWKKLEKQDN